MAWHLAGRMSREDAVRSTVRRTRTLARRQLAWFRRDPRIRWFAAGPEGAVEVVDQIEEYLRAETDAVRRQAVPASAWGSRIHG